MYLPHFDLEMHQEILITLSESTEMDAVYKELDKVKTEMEGLKEECRTKTELSENLRKAHCEQLIKLKEAKSQIEKRDQELNAKSGEISELRQLYESLKSSLNEKESLLSHLRFADEKLQVDFGKRTCELEGENKQLALALDEVTLRNQDLELKICAGNEEIEGLKKLLSDRMKKCLEAEQRMQATKGLQQRNDVILRVEEENRSLKDQLKWKNEQFAHLEEAHERLQIQFRSSKEEWDVDKSALLEEICKLQTSLDSQTRITESLETQLRMCNQALAHEESKRKFLEAEVSELNSRFENVFIECQEAKSKIEQLTLDRDEEIAKLRNLLGTKETVSKEMEYRFAQLEQENQELKGSLKVFQDAEIKNAEATFSLKKMQNKMKDLEKLHGKCSTNLKEKEIEWSDRMDKVRGAMNGYISELKGKNKQIQELQVALENCHFLLEVQNEEIFVVTMVLQSEFSAAYLNLFIAKAEMELQNKEKDEKILLLTEQVEIKNSSLDKVHVDLEQKCKEVALLMERVEPLDCMKQQQTFIEEELERHKEMLAESRENQFFLENQVLQMKKTLKEESRDVYNALEKVNSEATKKISELNEGELELKKWKATAENLKIVLDENQKACKEEKESLLAIVKEQEENICNMQQQIVSLESTVAAKTEAMQAFVQEQEQYIQIAEDKNSSIENLRSEIAYLKEESSKRETEAEKAFGQEKECLLKIVKERAQSIEDLLGNVKLLEQDFRNASISFLEKQIMIDVLSEAVKDDENLKRGVIEEDATIVKLKLEINALSQKLEIQEASLVCSKERGEQLEALLQANQKEAEKVKDELENERRHKGALLEDIVKLSSQNEDLLIQIERIYEEMSGFCSKDIELMGFLEKILPESDEEKGLEMNLIEDDDLVDSARIVNAKFCHSRKGIEEIMDNRLPLTELNY